LAVTSAKRLAMVPEYPTIAESGYPDYQAGNWHGLLVPAKTPREIVSVLHGAVATALKQQAVATRLGDLGYLAGGDQPEEFGRFMQSEIAALARVVKDLRLKVD
jgi:tripartite-type tricarboxylate transporter receptor subunit TctC